MSGGAEDFDIKDTNVANIGSDEDKAARKAAAGAEKAWEGAGQEEGVQIWRIEKFQVALWPQEAYGSFYEGDSYIILHSYKKSDDEPALLYDLYFWLGTSTSQDEMGTAAYKTVELDDLLDGRPVQHREVMKHESSSFKTLFESLSYLKGGIDSGFNHVGPAAFVAKLLLVKKIGKVISVVEVPCTRESLNDGDSFVLDAGETIYVWSGESASPFEKHAANTHAENLESKRHGAAKATTDVDGAFWEKLGGEGPIKSAEEAEPVLPCMPSVGEGILFKLSDASGSVEISEVGRGELTKSMLDSSDVYVVDTGPELLVWIGAGASDKERYSAFNSANAYLKQQDKPFTTPITVLKEEQAHRNARFTDIFSS